MKPMVRSNMCLNSHPEGCEAVVRRQISYAKSHMQEGPKTPKLALVLGCSTGYGLASRSALGFGYGAVTLGVSLEKPARINKPGTPGYYNNLTFDYEAAKIGLVSKTIDGDVFSRKLKVQVLKEIKELAQKARLAPKIDTVIYSVAAPVRPNPEIKDTIYKSVIKPIGEPFSGRTLDMMTGILYEASVQPATTNEIEHTIKVMGGEDWFDWIVELSSEDLLAEDAKVLAYTYIGPELSWPIYKNGTIGRAKEDLEHTCKKMNNYLADKGARAYISVNKAVVTRASAVIPIIPFYVSCLFKVMKQKGLHEGCIEQMVRLFNERLYTEAGVVPVDEQGRIRLDDWELRDDVQKETAALMATVNQENVFEKTDLEGFKHDFLEAHGFDVAGINYGD